MNGATYYDRNRDAVLARYDALPDLRTLRALGRRFDLILLSAVWMHVAPKGRERAFRILSELLGPSGLLVITLRLGGDAAENAARRFHDTSAEELIGHAKPPRYRAAQPPGTAWPKVGRQQTTHSSGPKAATTPAWRLSGRSSCTRVDLR